MKGIYKYKISWLIPISNDEGTFNKEIKQILKILGVKSLDYIKLKNDDLKTVKTYNSFIMFPYGVAQKETIKYLKKQFEQNKNIKYIEMIRK